MANNKDRQQRIKKLATQAALLSSILSELEYKIQSVSHDLNYVLAPGLLDLLEEEPEAKGEE